MPDGINFTPEGLTLATLAPVRRWVAWQTEDRDDKPTKTPKNPATGGNAKSDDAGTWSERDAAESRAACLPKPYGEGGVGLMLGIHDDLAIGGLDLDTCRDRDSGQLAAWTTPFIEALNTYSEVSPSGMGLKLFFRYDPEALPELREIMGTKTGKQWKPVGEKNHPPGVELYLCGRFFAVTDRAVNAAPINHVPVSVLRWIITEAGPATFRAPEAKPDFGFAFDDGGSGGDQSRSGKAMRVAARIKGAGGTYEQFVEALDKKPETAAWKAEKGLPNGGREMRRTWDNCRAKPRDADGAGDGGDDMELTEDGVALAFTEKFHDALRYCHDTGAWYVWEGSHWRQNRDKIAFSWARQLVRKLNRSAEFKTKAITGKASFAASVERFAQADRAFAVTTEKWDRARDLLGTPGGTVDLRTGIMRPAAREDHITKTTAIAPAETADCPTWRAFLDQATANDAGLIRFLQQWCGYCLSGSTREHALLFIYGPGGNGKSVFLNTLAGILADYVASAAMDTFTSSPGDKHPTDLAMLRGARLVTATETEEGRAWAEARIKQMTGGDPVTARFMRQDFFTYTPQFKLTIAGNHKPALRNVDEAARRRFNIVPFLHKPETPDRHLEHKLKAEWPGILRWMIEGCLDWQEHGLVRPAIVVDATAEYFEQQDAFSLWLKECCIIGPPASAKPGELLASFTGWCQRNGEMTPNRNKMRGMLERVPGLKYVTNGGTQWVRNIKLLPSGQQGGADHE
ncbi:phage/plasmid primase, P4 family [Roseococcus suduntuyensis]|uniref:P4 family phage/plasmid primase-like protein n=1 Tax=Roseococcus suduntuyensis TaxID=455361 RepID=A0A840AHB6_9PROT|nr:phage/plasmid primase, P4 family [Roseococcus suduntuyensis]MBB3899963.1 P4 family phage/plasmid primase-like protein [Roseococcus suduntuyensis]